VDTDVILFGDLHEADLLVCKGLGLGLDLVWVFFGFFSVLDSTWSGIFWIFFGLGLDLVWVFFGFFGFE
jgi:hypothetical protein